MICPICKKPTTWQDNPNRPFCSERCKLIDFGTWIDEGYRVPTETGNEYENSDDNDEHISTEISSNSSAHG